MIKALDTEVVDLIKDEESTVAKGIDGYKELLY